MPDETKVEAPVEPSLDDLLAQYIAGEEAGSALDRQELLKHYPQFADDLREFFSNRDQMQRLAQPLRGDAQVPRGSHPLGKVRYFGDYELLEEVAAGGMGIIYKARQRSLNRIVAVKMILKGTLAREDDVKRFRAEAEAAASLQHPAIVAIHEVGLHEGQHYFSMDYVDGHSLAELPREQPLSAHQAAEYIRDAAEAVHYAHQQGTLHRDLKPSNILIDHQGRVRITDFGLAKRIEGNSDLTLTGQILGTPSYMPPEQATSKRSLVGVASDIYSLGAVLYELLTGRPPFRGESPAETLRQVEILDPVSPRLLNPATPRDLETICLKCLEKEPHKRYGTSQLLVDDLRRYLRSEPILALPISQLARTWRWCRRNALLATTAAMAATLLFAIAAVASVAYVRELSYRSQIEREQEATQKALTQSQIAVSDLRTLSGLSAAQQGETAIASVWFASAAESLHEQDTRYHENRLRAAIWGSMQPCPSNAVMHPETWVMEVGFHPSGRFLKTWSPRCGPHPGEFRVWDLSKDQALSLPADNVSCGTWSKDGQILALGTNRGRLLLHQFPNGHVVHEIMLEDRIDMLEVDPTGRYLAVVYGPRDEASRDDREMKSGNNVRVWDLHAHAFVTPELNQPAPISSLVFHPGGKQVVVGNRRHTCLTFAVPSESDTPLSPPLEMYQYGPAIVVGERPARPIYANAGRTLCTILRGGSLKLWDTESWAPISAKPPQPPFVDDVKGTAITHNEELIVLSGRGGLTLLATKSLQARQSRPSKARQYVFDVAFSPDGRYLLSGGGDRTAQLWAIPGAEPVGPAIEHASTVLAVAWSRDGQQFATAQRGGLVRVWSMPSSPLPIVKLSPGGLATLSSSSAYVASRGSTGKVGPRRTRVYSTSDGTPAGPEIRTAGPLLDAAFSPDEKELALLIAQTNSLYVVDWRTGVFRGQPVAMPSQPRSMRYDPPGKVLGILCADGEIVVVDTDDLTIRSRWSNQVAYHYNNSYVDNGALTFSPLGESIITYQTDPIVRVWDWPAAKLRYKIEGNLERCSGVSFSHDGKLVATAYRDNTARVWDYLTGRAVSQVLMHPDWVYSAQFDPRGELLITSCRDSQVRVWNWRSGKLVCPPMQHGHEVHTAAFTPDGRFAVTASEDKTVKIWELVTGKPIAPTIQLGEAALNLQISPDGRRLVVGGFPAGAVHLVSLDALFQQDPLSLRGRRLLAELTANRKAAGVGGLTTLTTDEWYSTWRELFPKPAALNSNPIREDEKGVRNP